MSNMSYCRFQNTLEDLMDCQEYFDKRLSGDEMYARRKMLRICKQIAKEYDLDNLPESEA